MNPMYEITSNNEQGLLFGQRLHIDIFTPSKHRVSKHVNLKTASNILDH